MKREIEVKQPVIKKAPHGSRSVVENLLTPIVCSVLATLGIFGGISSLFVGILAVALHAVVSGDRLFDRVGTILLIVAIPMILVGSIFLDEIERKK